MDIFLIMKDTSVMLKYFQMLTGTDKIYVWKSKGLSKQRIVNVAISDNNFAPKLTLTVLCRAYSLIINRITRTAITTEINTKDIKLAKTNVSSFYSKRHLQSISLFT